MTASRSEPVLVTGGAGFIGSALVRRLVAAGARVVTVDALIRAGSIDAIAPCMAAPDHLFIHADIRDARTVRDIFAAHRPRAVMHLAAESHVDRSISAPLAALETNVTGTANLLQASREVMEKDFRFVHVSTDEVFGSLGAAGRFNTQSHYDPRSPYAASKAAADHLARAWHVTYGVPVIVTNCTNNYGPWQDPGKLIPLIIRSALREEPLPVYGDGTNVREWIHVDDHVDGLLAALEIGDVGATYLFGSGEERRNIDLVGDICAVLDELRPRRRGSYADLIRFVTDRPGHDHRYAVDCGVAHDRLNWYPQRRLATSLRPTVEWYVENSAWMERMRQEERSR